MPRRFVYSLLFVILLSGLTLRVWDVNFDRGMLSHPDERSTACTYAPSMRLPSSWDEFWDPQRSPLNPLWNLERQERRSYTYGHFPLYLGVALGETFHVLAPLAERLGFPDPWLDIMARANQGCDAIAVTGRLLIASLDTLTILLLYLLTRRIYNRAAGLLAAAFYAFTAQAVQLSHFFTMDPASTTFTVLAVLGAVQMVQDRNWRAVVVAGVGAGLAMAGKFSALPILAAPVVAAILLGWDAQRRGRAEGYGAPAREQLVALLGAPVALLLAGVTFFITSPYAVLDWENFAQATLIEQGAMVRGVADWPFTRQYRNTTPYLYFIEQQVRWGLGWPLGLVALAGTAYAVSHLITGLIRFVVGWFRLQWSEQAPPPLGSERLALIVVWSWVVPYFGITGAFLAKFNRYMSPVLPFVMVFAAGLIWRLWTWQQARATNEPHELEESPSPVRRWDGPRILAVTVASVGLLGGLFWSAAYVNGVYNREHPWSQAARWLYQNAPQGSVVLSEQWDDPPPYTVPGEPDLNMGAAGLNRIDWGPYEEDTAEKYEILKAKLREADFVWYSSKRIYDSVDELPERYPMTIRYYEAMWSGELGFELAYEVTTPPRLFGIEFEDRTADESWSLYDHPQVTVFRKVRDLSDAEFDAVLGGTWVGALPYYRGADSPLSPFLNLLGLGSRPESQGRGLISRVVGLLTGETREEPAPSERTSLWLDRPLAELPVVDNYRWNAWASTNEVVGIVWWWLVLALLGLAAWPIFFPLFRPLRDRGYLFSRTLGWLLAGWLLWWLASGELLINSVRNSWLMLIVLALVGGVAVYRQRSELRAFLRSNWPLLLAGEGLFAFAYLAFVRIRIGNPDLWQPWLGGEKFMEFAFLNGNLRSPSFPPVDPHFAGGFINYYYFGLYLVSYLIKLTGIYAEVAFNLAMPTLFALTIVNAFAVAYSALGWRSAAPAAPLNWRTGFTGALLAPLFVTVIGNLDGFAQLVRNLAQLGAGGLPSAFSLITLLSEALQGLGAVLMDSSMPPAYDFWGPSRVIPETINEFPYWSFLFADLHPHVIGIPLAGVFIGAMLTLLLEYQRDWRKDWSHALALLLLFSLLLGTLASVNLWELPTYFGLGLLTLLVMQVRRAGRIYWVWTIATAALYMLLAYLFYLPFFQHYVGVGASGVGLVKAGDELGRWLLIWGMLAFVLLSWLLYSAVQPVRRERFTAWVASLPLVQPAPADLADALDDAAALPEQQVDPSEAEEASEPLLSAHADVDPSPRASQPLAGERWLSQAMRFFDRLPRLLYWQRLLVTQPSLGYLLTPVLILGTILAAILAWWADRTVLAFCLLPLGPAIVLLWRRSQNGSPTTLLITILTATGLAILAGTQVVFLKDFLAGGSYYRMNTLFKFFSQVWVLWGVAAALAVVQLWRGWLKVRPTSQTGVWLRLVWFSVFSLLLVASLAFPIYGTPARLDTRMVGWRPPIGTLNGLEYMREGSYTWEGRDAAGQPLPSLTIELRYDWAAIYWLLDNVRGNLVIVESSERDYYRAGGTRIASMTGLSGLSGFHEGEQRYGEDLGPRDHLYREFWNTADPLRTQQIIDELDIALIYAGQLERYLHPAGVEKLQRMADEGGLTVLYENEQSTIYAVPGRLQLTDEGYYVPQARG